MFLFEIIRSRLTEVLHGLPCPERTPRDLIAICKRFAFIKCDVFPFMAVFRVVITSKQACNAPGFRRVSIARLLTHVFIEVVHSGKNNDGCCTFLVCAASVGLRPHDQSFGGCSTDTSVRATYISSQSRAFGEDLV